MKTKKWMTAAIALMCMVLLNSCSYNKMVEKDEAVSTAWSNVETQYQRRADLIPNLVSTVKGYAQHESSTLEAVVEARSKATQITVDPSNLTAEKLAEYQKAQGAVTSALGKLLAVTENYPQLRANENFSELQAQLEGTENRITEARKRYNDPFIPEQPLRQHVQKQQKREIRGRSRNINGSQGGILIITTILFSQKTKQI